MKTARRIVLSAMFLSTVTGFAQTAETPSTKAAVPAPAPPKALPDRHATLVKEWERAKLGAQEYLDAMPEEHIGFKPTPEIRSFAEQFLHIASAHYTFAASASGKANPYDPKTGQDLEKMEVPKKSKVALQKIVLESYDFMITAVKSIDPKTFDDSVKLFSFEMPRYLLLNKALEHHAHHRGQTTIYLRLKGIKPPSERLF